MGRAARLGCLRLSLPVPCAHQDLVGDRIVRVDEEVWALKLALGISKPEEERLLLLQSECTCTGQQ